MSIACFINPYPGTHAYTGDQVNHDKPSRREAGSGFELDIFIGTRVGEHRNQPHARDRRPRP
jgi:hypothetical protein